MLGFGTFALAVLLSKSPIDVRDLTFQQPKPTLTQTIFPTLTGENGLEEYFRAIDLMNDGVNSIYTDPESDAPADASPAVRDERDRLSTRLKSMDYLETERAFAARYSKVYDLIVQGNLKPCITPPPENNNPKGLTSVFQIARVIQARAYSQSADGKESESLETLLNGLTFSLRSGSLNTMAYLVNVLGERTLFNELLDELPKMSLADATRLSSFVDQAIKEPPLTITLLQRSAQVHELMFQQAMDSNALRGGNRNEFPPYLSRLASATPAELASFAAAVRKDTADAYNEQITALQAPEANWYDASSGWKAEFAPRKASSTDSIDDLALAMARDLAPSFRGMVVTELRRRAQLRILGLHAQIIAYKWRKHKLPVTLSEVAGSATTFDPLSGEPFAYQITSAGGYRLYSKGRPETGVVELHYDSPAGGNEVVQP